MIGICFSGARRDGLSSGLLGRRGGPAGPTSGCQGTRLAASLGWSGVSGEPERAVKGKDGRPGAGAGQGPLLAVGTGREMCEDLLDDLKIPRASAHETSIPSPGTVIVQKTPPVQVASMAPPRISASLRLLPGYSQWTAVWPLEPWLTQLYTRLPRPSHGPGSGSSLTRLFYKILLDKHL